MNAVCSPMEPLKSRVLHCKWECSDKRCSLNQSARRQVVKQLADICAAKLKERGEFFQITQKVTILDDLKENAPKNQRLLTVAIRSEDGLYSLFPETIVLSKSNKNWHFTIQDSYADWLREQLSIQSFEKKDRVASSSETASCWDELESAGQLEEHLQSPNPDSLQEFSAEAANFFLVSKEELSS